MLAAAIALYLLTFRSDELNVFAAASLKDSFGQVAREFQSSHPGIIVRLNFAGSQQLASQIDQGAPADVFASASPKDLERVEFDAATRRDFASNRLVIVAPTSGQTIRNLQALETAQRIVLAAPQVPAGGYARTTFELAAKRLGQPWLSNVRAHVVSEELDVRAVLAKVVLGEADAGVVYASDAVSAGAKVKVTLIEGRYQPKIRYPIAAIKGSHAPALAREFIQFVLGPTGRKDLKAQGFSAP
jgi:molybdate transport system substrate-binding protein